MTDNATFTSGEFREWCNTRGIIHLSGAQYHPETNGAAERLVQSFKNSLKKSSLQAKAALQQFIMQYRRTPLASGYRPSELLNGRKIRALIDVLVPSPAHDLQARQNRQVNKAKRVASERPKYSVGTPRYTLYCGPRRQKDPRWMPAVIVKRLGAKKVNVRVFSKFQLGNDILSNYGPDLPQSKMRRYPSHHSSVLQK